MGDSHAHFFGPCFIPHCQPLPMTVDRGLLFIKFIPLPSKELSIQLVNFKVVQHLLDPTYELIQVNYKSSNCKRNKLRTSFFGRRSLLGKQRNSSKSQGFRAAIT